MHPRGEDVDIVEAIEPIHGVGLDEIVLRRISPPVARNPWSPPPPYCSIFVPSLLKRCAKMSSPVSPSWASLCQTRMKVSSRNASAAGMP